MNPSFGRIEYRSKDRFEQEYLKEIQEECDLMNRDRDWWSQPPHLYDKIKYPLFLTGESELLIQRLSSLDGFQSRYIDPRDDLIMALVDYPKVLEILATLSLEHQITWNVFQTLSENYEVPLGTIVNGQISDSLIQHQTETIDRYGITETELSDTALHKEIFSRYFDENLDPIFKETESD